MSGDDFRMIAVAGLLLVSSALCFSAGVGVLRFPDTLARLHAVTKPQVLGLLLMMSAVALHMPSWGTITTLMLIAAFQVIYTPVAGHMIGRAAYRARTRQDLLFRDDLAKPVEDASRHDSP